MRIWFDNNAFQAQFVLICQSSYFPTSVIQSNSISHAFTTCSTQLWQRVSTFFSYHSSHIIISLISFFQFTLQQRMESFSCYPMYEGGKIEKSWTIVCSRSFKSPRASNKIRLISIRNPPPRCVKKPQQNSEFSSVISTAHFKFSKEKHSICRRTYLVHTEIHGLELHWNKSQKRHFKFHHIKCGAAMAYLHMENRGFFYFSIAIASEPRRQKSPQ